MTESEAIEIAAKLLAGHHCDRCGQEWITGRSTTYVAHKCAAPPRPIIDWRPPRERLDDDRRQWALTQLGGALEDAIPEEDRLRRVDP